MSTSITQTDVSEQTIRVYAVAGFKLLKSAEGHLFTPKLLRITIYGDGEGKQWSYAVLSGPAIDPSITKYAGTVDVHAMPIEIQNFIREVCPV